VLAVRDFTDCVNAWQIGLRCLEIGPYITQLIAIEAQIFHTLKTRAKAIKHHHRIVGSTIDLACLGIERVGTGRDIRFVQKLHPVSLASQGTRINMHRFGSALFEKQCIFKRIVTPAQHSNIF